MNASYTEFLRSKATIAPSTGFDVDPADISKILKSHQRQIVQWAVAGGSPLQLEIVERLVRRFSNPGDVVLDPFAGLGTVPLQALRMGRQGLGVELNADYWRDSVSYLQAEQAKQHVPSLFDALDAEAAA